ncbi:hypothetical protein PMAYCL1PPCAC_21343, partial [Pristionchus mayeri]
RLTVGIPMAIFTAIGLQLNIVLWRIITIQKVILYTNFTIALDRFLIFGAPRVGHSTIIGCYKRFNAYQLRFQYGCSNIIICGVPMVYFLVKSMIRSIKMNC